MKTLLFAIFAGLFSCACHQPATTSNALLQANQQTDFPNFLKGTHWSTHGSCFIEGNHQTIQLSVIDSSDFRSRWGYFIQFDGTTYRSYYSAQCGMDCYTTVEGGYRFTGDSTVQVTVASIRRSGYCGDSNNVDETQNPNTTYEYRLEKTGKNLTLRLK